MRSSAATRRTRTSRTPCLKFGLCQQRLAGLIAQPQERIKKYNEARATYEKLMRKDFGVHPLHMAYATFERGKCITLAGDINTGINEMRKFTADPLKQTPVAPQAVLQLATYLRAQNRVPEAVDVFAKNRDFLEGVLAKDPEKGPTMISPVALTSSWRRACAKSGKLPEARRHVRNRRQTRAYSGPKRRKPPCASANA